MPPELLLFKQITHPESIDVWSLGCIFAELLNMLKENAATFLDR